MHVLIAHGHTGLRADPMGRAAETCGLPVDMGAAQVPPHHVIPLTTRRNMR